MSRAQVWRALQSHESTEPIWRMFHWAYATPSPLLVYNRTRLHTMLQSSEGVRQGDPLAGLGFAISVQPMYVAAIHQLLQCHAVSIQDDLTLIGPREQVFTAYDRIVTLAEKYHLTLRTEKCAVYIPPTLECDSTRDKIQSECTQRHLAHFDHLESLGVLLGSDAAIESHLSTAVDSHDQLFAGLEHSSMPVQIGYALLRYCALPRLGFLARTTHPRHFQQAAARFDTRIIACFRTLMKIGLDTHMPSISSEDILTQLTLPIKAGGLGLRPMERISHSAYFASLYEIMPDFIRAFPPSVCRDYTLTQVHHETLLQHKWHCPRCQKCKVLICVKMMHMVINSGIINSKFHAICMHTDDKLMT